MQPIPQQAVVGYQSGAPMQAIPVLPAYKLIEVIVPNGVGPGGLIEIVDPQTNQVVQATVPPGVGPGMRFDIQVPTYQQNAVQGVARPVGNLPVQRDITSPGSTDDGSCAAFLTGMCFCCTICTLFR